MFRDMLSSRGIIFGLVFFVLIVGGSLLYSWHVRRNSAAEIARTSQSLQQLGDRKETRTAQDPTVSTNSETREPSEKPFENEVPQTISEEIEVLPSLDDLADVFLPDNMVSTKEEPAEDVPVSPYGYGPYPEVPNGYPEHLPPVWTWSEEKRQFYESSRLEDFELMARVLIKLWNQGDRDFTAVIRDDTNGKVYPLYKDVIYATWADLKEENGKIIGQYARNQLSSNQTQRVSFIDFMEGRIPPNIRFIDRATSGINPHDFLDLPKR